MVKKNPSRLGRVHGDRRRLRDLVLCLFSNQYKPLANYYYSQKLAKDAYNYRKVGENVKH